MIYTKLRRATSQTLARHLKGLLAPKRLYFYLLISMSFWPATLEHGAHNNVDIATKASASRLPPTRSPAVTLLCQVEK